MCGWGPWACRGGLSPESPLLSPSRAAKWTSLALAPAWSPAPASPPWAASTRQRQGLGPGGLGGQAMGIVGGRGGSGSLSLNTRSLQLVSVGGQPRMKLTEDPEKQTLPGRKAAYRLLDADGEAPTPPPLRGLPSTPQDPTSFLVPPPSPKKNAHRRVSAAGPAAAGGGAGAPGWPGAEGVASRGPRILHRAAGPGGAPAAALGPGRTGD